MVTSTIWFLQAVRVTPLPLAFSTHLFQGGTAACVAAGRLALADPSLSILLGEGGKNNLNEPTVTTPALYLTHLAPDSQTALFYKSQASQELLGREAIVPCGGILGGGSSINFMMYTRAQAVDYDAWNMEGWDFKSLLPSFKRVIGLFLMAIPLAWGSAIKCYMLLIVPSLKTTTLKI